MKTAAYAVVNACATPLTKMLLTPHATVSASLFCVALGPVTQVSSLVLGLFLMLLPRPAGQMSLKKIETEEN